MIRLPTLFALAGSLLAGPAPAVVADDVCWRNDLPHFGSGMLCQPVPGAPGVFLRTSPNLVALETAGRRAGVAYQAVPPVVRVWVDAWECYLPAGPCPGAPSGGACWTNGPVLPGTTCTGQLSGVPGTVNVVTMNGWARVTWNGPFGCSGATVVVRIGAPPELTPGC